MRVNPMLLLVAFLPVAPCAAQGLQAVHPLAGYHCLSLNVSEKDLSDPKAVVPIFAKPSATSAIIGQASMVLFAPSPEIKTGGFLQVLRFDGSVGWLDERYAVPFHTPDGRPGHCVPSVMSNGRLGIG